MNTRNLQNSLFHRISSGLLAHATQFESRDLARLGRGLEAASQFQNLLFDLKLQLARKAALRAQTQVAVEVLEAEPLAA